MPFSLSRRELLASAAATVFCQPALAEMAPVPLVDTHVHCFAGRNHREFPFHPRGPYQPEEVATPEHLLKCMTAADVAYAVVVHPEPYQDDHRYLEHCLAVGTGRLKGTLLVFADQPLSLAKVPDLVRRVPIVAVRVHAYAQGRLPPFRTQELRNLWKLATDHNLAVQLHFEPRFAAGFLPLIKEFSKTKVVIDHLGRPMQGTEQEYAEILKWSSYSNTVMKMSSLPVSEGGRNVQDIVRQVTRAWGAERIIYGGGFSGTATGMSYRQAIESAKEYLSHLSTADQAQILGGTAVRLFQFGK